MTTFYTTSFYAIYFSQLFNLSFYNRGVFSMLRKLLETSLGRISFINTNCSYMLIFG